MSEVERSSTILICGLPGSGKTTFLGALSYLITEKEIETVLKHAELSEERAFLNRLADRWCKCEPMRRTLPGDDESMVLHLTGRGSSLAMNFPDLAGETWKQVWEHHHCSLELAKVASSSSGIIIFLHADQIRKPLSVVDAEELADAMAGGRGEINGGANAETILENGVEPTPEPKPWMPSEHTPTQAIVVALLQHLSTSPMGKKRQNVAVVLSAWDMIPEGSPDGFLKSELPLLYQYLYSGFDYAEWKVFGVSAQGGEYGENKSGTTQRLLEMERPSERIVVNDGEVDSHDLTTILSWIIDQ